MAGRDEGWFCSAYKPTSNPSLSVHLTSYTGATAKANETTPGAQPVSYDVWHAFQVIALFHSSVLQLRLDN